MRRNWTGLVCVLVISVAGLQPQTAEADGLLPRNPAIEDTIQSQLNAFLTDDFTTAFTYASPSVQGYFGNSDRFGWMVRNGYPMVWRPSEVEYQELGLYEGAFLQKVEIVDSEGRRHVLVYQMIEGPMSWRINGVTLLPSNDVDA